MRTVKGVSKMSGISVRTLHYYDEIGLKWTCWKAPRIRSAWKHCRHTRSALTVC